MAERAQHSGGGSDERGFTLVELVVSLTILAIGVVGVIGVMNSSFGVAVRTNDRSRAVHLATRELESLRAQDYAAIVPSATSVTTTRTVGGKTYTIETAITWGSRGTNLTAVKNATVNVRWPDAGGTVHDVAQTTTLYPGGLGPTAATGSASCGSAGTPSAPTGLTAGAPGVLTESAVDLAWSPPSSSSPAITTWRIDMTTSATTQTLTTTHPAGSLSYRVEGLSASTQYSFKVAGVSNCGVRSAWSPTQTITTSSSSQTGCTIGTPNVTPSAVRRANNGNNAALETSPTVSVNTAGDCTGAYVKYQAVAGTDRTQLLGGTSGVRSVGLTATGPWDIGVHSIDLFDGANTKRGSLLLTVCAHNASSCG